jgi:predicted phage-related endonuclease
VTGARKAYVAALVGGNQIYCRTVERDEKLILFWFFCKIGKYFAVNYVINTAL